MFFERIAVLNIYILSIYSYILTFTPFAKAMLTDIKRRSIIFVCRLPMVSFEVLTRLKGLRLPLAVWNVVRRGEASQLSAAFRLGILGRNIRRGAVFEQASEAALPSIKTIWDRTHRKFKNISGIIVPMLFDRILSERPLVLANAVLVARKKLQSRN